MNIRRLLLRDFRNYAELLLEPAGGLNVLVGPNAQGKTNLLESVLVLAVGRSPRAAREDELIRWGRQAAYIAADISRENGTGRLETIIDRAAPRRVIWNGNPLRPGQALGIVNAVSFFPDDLHLVKGAPAARRRLLDVLLCQADAVYRRHLSRLVRVLRQRNGQLKALRGQGGGPALLDPWDEQLLAEGVPIMVRRARAVRRLGEHAARLHARISAGREHLQLAYRPFFERYSPDGPPAQALGEGTSALEDPGAVAERFRAELRMRRHEEIARGVSLIGPHRDDVAFLIGGADARTFASQGQQRTAVLACKLAELAYLQEETGEGPLLLLDDVLSELDEERRTQLLEVAREEQVQAFLTTTRVQPLPGSLAESARIFRVQAGTVSGF
ncbi:MAG: DNA replication/repair protein RecF [Firmicutes bacterium]|nr:DNA replication/repair protein RecF [Bacillota bacterium]